MKRRNRRIWQLARTASVDILGNRGFLGPETSYRPLNLSSKLYICFKIFILALKNSLRDVGNAIIVWKILFAILV